MIEEPSTVATDPESDTPPESQGSSMRGKTMQIRTLCQRTGKPYSEIKKIFMRAGLWNPKMRYLSRVDVGRALEALQLTEIPPGPVERSVEAKAVQREDADLAAALGKGDFIPPSARGSGSGNVSDDPVPRAILDGDFPEHLDVFPYPRPGNVPANLIISAINNSPGPVAEAHRQARIDMGWRWIDVNATALLNQLYPDGRWRRMTVDPNGRLCYKDLALACFPRSAWERRKARQRQAGDVRLASAKESFKANVADAQRTLQDHHGISGERHIQAVVEDADTAEDRANFADAKSSGRDPRRARVGLGRAATR